MAVQAVIIGALKVALKKAAKKVAVEVGKEVVKGSTKAVIKAAAQKALEEVGKKAMSDAQAVILNRLKSAPTKILYEYASNQMGIPVADLKKIIKTFNQTPKMKDIATGQKFRELARNKLKKELGLKNITDKSGRASNIQDILRRANEYNKRIQKEERDKKGKSYNSTVLGLLTDIQNELVKKVHGISTAQNQFKVAEQFSLDILKYFKDSNTYDENNVISLEKILSNLSLDLERYETDSMTDVLLIEESANNWKRYDKQSIIDFVNDTKENVRLSLKPTISQKLESLKPDTEQD